MQTIGAFEAKTHLSALLEQVEKGQVMFITKHGKPVAKLSPIGISAEDIKKSVWKLKEFQAKHKIVLDLECKTLRDEGRK